MDTKKITYAIVTAGLSTQLMTRPEHSHYHTHQEHEYQRINPYQGVKVYGDINPYTPSPWLKDLEEVAQFVTILSL